MLTVISVQKDLKFSFFLKNKKELTANGHRGLYGVMGLKPDGGSDCKTLNLLKYP